MTIRPVSNADDSIGTMPDTSTLTLTLTRTLILIEWLIRAISHTAPTLTRWPRHDSSDPKMDCYGRGVLTLTLAIALTLTPTRALALACPHGVEPCPGVPPWSGALP